MTERPVRYLARPGSARIWLGANFWSRAGGPRMWTARFKEDSIAEELAVLARHGLSVTRSFLLLPDFLPDPYTIDEDCIERYARFLDISQEQGIPTIATLVVGHMSGQNWDLPWRNGRDLYADGWMLARQSWFASSIARRFKDHPALAGWLLSNEITLYAGETTAEYGRSWAEILTQAIRSAGARQPVSTGDGAWGAEVTGHDNGFRLRDLSQTVDFIGPHVYPASNDPVRQQLAAAFTCELCQVGLPVVLEEFGVSTSFTSDRHAGDYYRQVLHSTLLAGATGWIAWNSTDFDLVDEEPYRHHPFELNFGISRSDGTPKAPLFELQRFRRLLDAIDFPGLRRAPTDTAILVPSFLDAGYPFHSSEERRLVREVTFQGYVAAREAGLAPALWREEDEPPEARLLLVPSAKALLGPTWYRLQELAFGGATVYVSFFSGGSAAQRGAWCPDLDGIFGVEHQLRPGLIERVDEDVVSWTVASGFAELETGDANLEFVPAGSENGRAMLPLVAQDAEVLARDHRGRPALVERRLGTGAMVLSTYPIEYFAASRPLANPEATYDLYRALAVRAGAGWTVRSCSPKVVVDRMVGNGRTEYVWLMSLSGEPVCERIETIASRVLEDLETGERLPGEVPIAAYEVRVCRLV